MAKYPQQTAKLLAKLEPVLGPPDEREETQRMRESVQSATTAPDPTAPTEYPSEWLEQAGGPVAAGGDITFEDAATAAAAGAGVVR